MKNSWWPSRTVSTPVNLARFFSIRKNFAQIWKSPNIPCRRGHRSYAIEQRIWIRSTVKDQINFFNRSSPLDTSNCGRTTTVDTCRAIIQHWWVNCFSDLFSSQRPCSSSSSGCDQSTLYNSSESEEEVSRWNQSRPTRQWTTTSSTSDGHLLSNIVDELSEQSSQSTPSNRRSNLGNIYLVNENTRLFCTANQSKYPTVS